ncbi:hypothetical protein GUJ93_ZPchr0010g9768 [Zizania palustris]|uniref:Reverse transcriptase domain-containing protein n=1 Tax=Zizania palustris TaxID=103762 RepID=A0A8J5W186_ZIZPA|nr:hypothetical protein GUJ93_ZPchr0010g9768 [Zizania palustris]
MLQCVINKAHSTGLILPPQCHNRNVDFPIVQYANDTMIFLRASQKDIFCLKSLMETFSQSNGPRVYFSKTCLIPLNIDDVTTTNLVATFGCKLGSLPIPYLVLPLCTRQHKLADFTPSLPKSSAVLRQPPFGCQWRGSFKLSTLSSLHCPLTRCVCLGCQQRLLTKLIGLGDTAFGVVLIASLSALWWRGKPSVSLSSKVAWASSTSEANTLPCSSNTFTNSKTTSKPLG